MRTTPCLRQRRGMILFCPWCCNMLMVENMGAMRFFCQTCPYVQNIQQKVRSIYMRWHRP